MGRNSTEDTAIDTRTPAAAADPGFIEGYLAVFGNVDSSAEVIRKGAFARCIASAVPAGTIPLMARHFKDGGDALECVGTIVAAHEDNYGLWIRAQFSSDANAQALRTRVDEGHIRGLSAGFYPLRWHIRAPITRAEQLSARAQDREHIVEWLEAKLVEGTLTVRPANELARIKPKVTS